MQLFDNVFGLCLTESGIASPVKREDLELIEFPEHKDAYDIALGSSIHDVAVDMTTISQI